MTIFSAWVVFITVTASRQMHRAARQELTDIIIGNHLPLGR